MEFDDDLEYLCTKLSKTDLYKNVHSSRRLMKRIISASSSGMNTTIVFPAVAKILASNDLILKKLAHWYIRDNANNNDLVLLIINTLLKDCEDPNPMTRGIAIRTLTSIPTSFVLDYCIQPITMCLADNNAYVRRAAVLAIVRVHSYSPGIIQGSGWLDSLYKMIRDSDPIVVVNCLHTLSVLLENEGGIVVNRNIAHHLLNRIDQFSNYHIVPIIGTLRKYSPRTEDEALEIMNIMDDNLKSSHSCIVIETVQYFLFLIRNMPHLKSELYNRASQQIHELLGTSNSELVYVLLEYIESLLSDTLDFSSYYKIVFCKYNDSQYLKIKKINLLPSLTNSNNVMEILEELKMYSLDTSVRKFSVNAMSRIAQNYPDYSEITIDSLLQLLKLHPEDLCEDVCQVLRTLDLNQLKDRDKALKTITDIASMIETESGKASFVSLLGDYGEFIDSSPYLLEKIIDDTIHNGSNELCMSVLTSGVRLLLKRPAECQQMFAVLLEHCLVNSNIVLRDKSLFYYHLLESNPDEAIKVMNVNK